MIYTNEALNPMNGCKGSNFAEVMNLVEIC